MRYFLLTLVAFLLIAAPAFAATTDDVDVTVNVTGTWYLCVSDGATTFTINNGEYDDGYVLPDSDEYQTANVKSNQPWNLYVKAAFDTNWPAAWKLWYAIGATTDGSDVEITTTDTYVWATNNAATNSTDTTFYYRISPIAYTDDWVGNHANAATITYTLTAKP